MGRLHRRLLPGGAHKRHERHKDWWYIAQRNILRSDKSTYGDHLEARSIWEAADGFVCWRLSLGLATPRNQGVIQWMVDEGVAGELATVPFRELSTLEIDPADLARWEQQLSPPFSARRLASSSSRPLANAGS